VRQKQRSSLVRRLTCETLEPRCLLTVVIGEISAHSSTQIAEDDGDLSDWIELHNSGASEVDLTDWSLSDRADGLSSWTFPAVVMPASERLIVYASGKDRSVVDQPLHASFQLSDTGEYLALSRPDGSKASEFFPFPNIPAGYTFGVYEEKTKSSWWRSPQPRRC
jgi:hypothetical protein